jgi:aspartyl-tRNA(Asn)/glutamyl-tRNA(Gln) amidotransferase subunit C
MTIDDTLLSKLEKLSALKIEDGKREEVKGQIANILSFVENLGELDEQLLDIPFPVVRNAQPFRKDEPSVDADITRIVMEHAPKTEENFFVVPKIIE